MNGIALAPDSGQLLLTGKLWPMLFDRRPLTIISRMTIASTRLVCCALLCSCVPRAGYAQTESYLSARRAVMRTFNERSKAGESGPALLSDHGDALKGLERRLRAVIGPISVPGFPDAGHINLESLFDADENFGLLDGLRFHTADQRTEMVVTTRVLMSTWLGEHAGRRNIPRNVDEALRSPDVYSLALSGDAAVYRYADLPIPDASRQGIASAMLILRAQDYGMVAPDMVLLSVVRGDRIFIIQSQTAVAVHTLPVCNAPIEAAFNPVADSGVKPQIRVNGDSLFAVYRSCYGEHLTSIPGIDQIIGQVSALVAALPLR